VSGSDDAHNSIQAVDADRSCRAKRCAFERLGERLWMRSGEQHRSWSSAQRSSGGVDKRACLRACRRVRRIVEYSSPYGMPHTGTESGSRTGGVRGACKCVI
jgi:hypothetical protein